MSDCISSFFSSYGSELKSTMRRLDNLIGRNHWLSVGNYKEEILRKLLRKLLPKKFEVSTGFILALNENAEPLISKQMDIIIWNSNDYSAIFRDDDFVIVPPEACKAVIEVKSVLRTKSFNDALSASENLHKFLYTPYISNLNIKKYIFAFDAEMEFPCDLFKCMHDFYCNDVEGRPPLDERINFISKHWLSSKSANSVLIDGVFVLGKGAILSEFEGSGAGDVCIVFDSLLIDSEEHDHVYTLFEHTINTEINSCNDIPGLFYVRQPGLMSMMKALRMKRPDKMRAMIIPDNYVSQHIFGDERYYRNK